MSSEDAKMLLTEQCGSLGHPIIYSSKKAHGNIIKEQVRESVASSFYQAILAFLREVLLPYGYPDSVSEDYFNYQLWDTIQAFCSTIISIFTTQAILKGVGVGNAEASALSATITWIMKDGTGMVGRIAFAWWKGNGLDCHCKKWRLFADLLNDLAMMLELYLPYLTDFSTQVLCVSTAMKSVVGVAGGATRASITNHQAIKGNTAEVAAKDGSQETLVNLIASFTGIFLINLFTDPLPQWVITAALVVLHLFANYSAVTSLIFKNLNDLRMALVLKSYLTVNATSTPDKVNQMESVLLGFGVRVEDLCGFRVVLGKSLANTMMLYQSQEIQTLIGCYATKKYLLVLDVKRRTIFVAFEQGERPEDVISAYFHAVLLAVATCIYNNEPLEVSSKRQLHHSTPITRLTSFMKAFHRNSDAFAHLPSEILVPFTEFMEQEHGMFSTALQMNYWRSDSHALCVDEWRAQWKDGKKLN